MARNKRRLALSSGGGFSASSSNEFRLDGVGVGPWSVEAVVNRSLLLAAEGAAAALLG